MVDPNTDPIIATVGCSELGFFCRTCESSFENEANLKAHLSRDHTEDYIRNPKNPRSVHQEYFDSISSENNVEKVKLVGPNLSGFQCNVCGMIWKRNPVGDQRKNHASTKGCVDFISAKCKFKKTACFRKMAIKEVRSPILYDLQDDVQPTQVLVDAPPPPPIDIGENKPVDLTFVKSEEKIPTIEDTLAMVRNTVFDTNCLHSQIRSEREIRHLFEGYSQHQQSEEYDLTQLKYIFQTFLRKSASGKDLDSTLHEAMSIRSFPVQDDHPEASDIGALTMLGWAWYNSNHNAPMNFLPKKWFILLRLTSEPDLELRTNSYKLEPIPKDINLGKSRVANENNLKDDNLFIDFLMYCWRHKSSRLNALKDAFKHKRAKNYSNQMFMRELFIPKLLLHVLTEENENGLQSIGVSYFLSLFFQVLAYSEEKVLKTHRIDVSARQLCWTGRWMRTGIASLFYGIPMSSNSNYHFENILEIVKNSVFENSLLYIIENVVARVHLIVGRNDVNGGDNDVNGGDGGNADDNGGVNGTDAENGGGNADDNGGVNDTDDNNGGGGDDKGGSGRDNSELTNVVQQNVDNTNPKKTQAMIRERPTRSRDVTDEIPQLLQFFVCILPITELSKLPPRVYSKISNDYYTLLEERCECGSESCDGWDDTGNESGFCPLMKNEYCRTCGWKKICHMENLQCDVATNPKKKKLYTVWEDDTAADYCSKCFDRYDRKRKDGEKHDCPLKGRLRAAYTRFHALERKDKFPNAVNFPGGQFCHPVDHDDFPLKRSYITVSAGETICKSRKGFSLGGMTLSKLRYTPNRTLVVSDCPKQLIQKVRDDDILFDFSNNEDSDSDSDYTLTGSKTKKPKKKKRRQTFL